MNATITITTRRSATPEEIKTILESWTSKNEYEWPDSDVREAVRRSLEEERATSKSESRWFIRPAVWVNETINVDETLRYNAYAYDVGPPQGAIDVRVPFPAGLIVLTCKIVLAWRSWRKNR